jgi:hypothetical protein
MENENNELAEQEIKEIQKLHEETMDNLAKQYEGLKNPTSIAESIEGMTEESAAMLAEHFKELRGKAYPRLSAAMQKFYDDLAAFNPEGEDKPL